MSLLTRIENWIVDDMTPRQVRYVQPVSPVDTSDQVAEIYRQIRRDFQLVPPLTLFSPVPDLLVSVWSLWREAQFVSGTVSRPVKEAIAASVSRINACPYCVDAHTGMLHASSEHQTVRGIVHDDKEAISNQTIRGIVDWASSTRTPGSVILRQPPFTAAEAPEIMGTALTYHFVNRMVSVFLVDTPMPVPAGAGALRRLAARIFGATVGKRIVARKPIAGESLRYIPDSDLPDDLIWAASNESISAALAGCIRTIEHEGKRALPESVRSLVNQQLSQWKGESKGLGRQWLEAAMVDIENRDRPVARLALLTAFAPYQVDDHTLQAVRNVLPGDRELLGITAWSSMAAARRTCSWLTTPLSEGRVADDSNAKHERDSTDPIPNHA